MHLKSAVVLVLTLMSLPLIAADGPAIEVGRAAPALSLAAGDGEVRSLAETGAPTVLIFYRGLWWPFCRTQLGELQENLGEFRARGAEVWGISPDPQDKLQRYATQNGIGFPLLSDGDLATITAWGIINPKSPTVPHPTAVVVDAEGVIRYLRQDTDYTNRPTPSEILEAIDALED